MSTQIRLTVIPAPAPQTRTVFLCDGPGVAFAGDDPTAPDLCCGACGRVLTRAVARRQWAEVVFRCRCGAFNHDPAMN